MTEMKNNIDTIAMVSFAMIGIVGIALIAGGLEDQDQWKLKFRMNDVDYTFERSSSDAMIVWHDSSNDGYTIKQFNLDSEIVWDNSTAPDSVVWESGYKMAEQSAYMIEHLDDILKEAKEHQALYDLDNEFMFYLDSPEHEKFCENNDWHLVCMGYDN